MSEEYEPKTEVSKLLLRIVQAVGAIDAAAFKDVYVEDALKTVDEIVQRHEYEKTLDWDV